MYLAKKADFYKLFELPLTLKLRKYKMRQFIGILLFVAILSGLFSCHNTTVQKPEKLIKKDQFVKMMVDIYLVQGMDMSINNPKALMKVTQTDLYYSVLKKYSVADTVFIRSLIYYTSFPKEYEKIHVEIMNVLNEAEEQFKPKGKLETESK